MPNIPAWELVVWGLSKFHTDPHRPIRIVMVHTFVKELLTASYQFYPDTLVVLLPGLFSYRSGPDPVTI